jgi:coenzyme PQQ biosynthesis protein PqqD
MNAIDLTVRPSLVPHVRLKTDPMTGAPTLLFPEGLLILNDTAHEIVRRCDGHATVAEILHALADEFDVGNEILREDVLENLEQLRRKNLLFFSV